MGDMGHYTIISPFYLLMPHRGSVCFTLLCFQATRLGTSNAEHATPTLSLAHLDYAFLLAIALAESPDRFRTLIESV